jgi:hypothetical protein
LKHVHVENAQGRVENNGGKDGGSGSHAVTIKSMQLTIATLSTK